MFGTGRLSAPEIGEAAASAREMINASSSSAGPPDVSPSLLRMAATANPGSSSDTPIGRHSNRNASRGIIRSFQQHSELPPAYEAQVKVWDPMSMSQTTKTMKFLPMHEVLGHVVKPGTQEQFCSCDESQEGFQTELASWGRRLGIDTASGYWAGIGLWGDSAVSFKNDSLYLLTWRLLTGTVRKRFWLVAFPKREICQCGCYGRHTLSTIFEVAAWSMRALLAGEYPKVDHEGNHVHPESYRGKLALSGSPKLPLQAAVLAKSGDWAWFKQALNLKSWSGEGEFQRICWLCEGAKEGPCPCYDFGRTAAWRKTRVDDRRHWECEHASGGFISPIFAIPGFPSSTASRTSCTLATWGSCSTALATACGNCSWSSMV